MKKLIFTALTFFIYSNYCQANLLDELLNDEALDSISCTDLNYNHENQRYNLTISLDVDQRKIKEVTLKQNYEQEITVIKQAEASSDLRTFGFSEYTLELSDKQYFNSRGFWANLKKSDTLIAEVVCSFIFSSSGE